MSKLFNILLAIYTIVIATFGFVLGSTLLYIGIAAVFKAYFDIDLPLVTKFIKD